MGIRIKICCISSVAEADLAIRYGASALGLVSNMPSGPGVIPDNLIRAIALSTPPPVATFLLTCETSAAGIIDHHSRTFTNTIQIVDELTEGSHQQIKRALPSVKIVQVIHVISESSVDEAIRISESVDALLLDSGNPGGKVKVLGGTGRTHNWALSRQIVQQSRVPVFLAGGLTSDNVQQAIDEVQPFGLDLCSGVRTNNRLDPEKLESFFKIIG